MDTRALSTAELVLEGELAWIIDEEGQCVRDMAAALHITRIHTGLRTVGFLGRGLAISRVFAKVGKVNGEIVLVDIPALVKAMANNEVNYSSPSHCHKIERPHLWNTRV